MINNFGRGVRKLKLISSIVIAIGRKMVMVDILLIWLQRLKKLKSNVVVFCILVMVFFWGGAFADGKSAIQLMWQVHTDSTENEIIFLSDSGINVVQSFSIFKSTEFEILSFFSLLRKYDMSVIPYVGAFIDFGESKCRLTNTGRETLRKLAAASGSIFAWHAFDEPSFSKVATQQCQDDIYTELKYLTPEIPVMISYNNTREIHYEKNFSPSASDIVALHKYSNPYPEDNQIALLDLAREKFSLEDKLVIITLRGFDSTDGSRVSMTDDSLLREYEFFFKDSNITNNIGFYGWHLFPNHGFKKLPHALKQFEEVMTEHLDRGDFSK